MLHKETAAAQSEAIICEVTLTLATCMRQVLPTLWQLLGTAFTSVNVKLIDRQRARKIICMFDGDAAGQHAAAQSIKFYR